MASYTITIKNKTGGKGGDPTKPAEPKKTATNKEIGVNVKAIGLATYHYAKQAALKQVSFGINTVSLRTGQEEMQQRMQFQYSAATKAISIAESMAMGLLLSGGNPIGAVAGLAVNLANEGMDYARAMQRDAMATDVEGVGIRMNTIRAGANMTRDNKIY